MFWRKKELTYDEELVVTVRHLQNWIEFMESEISGKADNVELPNLGDRKVAEVKRILASFRATVQFLEPLQ